MLYLLDDERCVINNILITTRNYALNRKCNDSVVCANDNGRMIFGTVVSLDVAHNTITVEIIDATKCYDNFYYYNTTNEIGNITISSKLRKCLIFQENNTKYLSILDYILLID